MQHFTCIYIRSNACFKYSTIIHWLRRYIVLAYTFRVLYDFCTSATPERRALSTLAFQLAINQGTHSLPCAGPPGTGRIRTWDCMASKDSYAACSVDCWPRINLTKESVWGGSFHYLCSYSASKHPAWWSYFKRNQRFQGYCPVCPLETFVEALSGFITIHKVSYEDPL